MQSTGNRSVSLKKCDITCTLAIFVRLLCGTLRETSLSGNQANNQSIKQKQKHKKTKILQVKYRGHFVCVPRRFQTQGIKFSMRYTDCTRRVCSHEVTQRSTLWGFAKLLTDGQTLKYCCLFTPQFMALNLRYFTARECVISPWPLLIYMNIKNCSLY